MALLKTLFLTLMLAGLAGAATMKVTVGGPVGEQGIPQLGLGADSTFLAEFNVARNPASSDLLPGAPGSVSLIVNGIFVGGSTFFYSGPMTAGWFAYSSGYSGFDLRITPTSPGKNDWLQLIMVFPESVSGYAPPDDAPEILTTGFTSLSSSLLYFPEQTDFSLVSRGVSDRGFYLARTFNDGGNGGEVPEPGTVGLMGAGLTAVAVYRRRFRRR